MTKSLVEALLKARLLLEARLGRVFWVAKPSRMIFSLSRILPIPSYVGLFLDRNIRIPYQRTITDPTRNYTGALGYTQPKTRLQPYTLNPSPNLSQNPKPRSWGLFEEPLMGVSQNLGYHSWDPLLLGSYLRVYIRVPCFGKLPYTNRALFIWMFLVIIPGPSPLNIYIYINTCK